MRGSSIGSCLISSFSHLQIFYSISASYLIVSLATRATSGLTIPSLFGSGFESWPCTYSASLERSAKDCVAGHSPSGRAERDVLEFEIGRSNDGELLPNQYMLWPISSTLFFYLALKLANSTEDGQWVSPMQNTGTKYKQGHAERIEPLR